MTEKVAPGEDQKYPLPSLEDLYESDSHFFFLKKKNKRKIIYTLYQAQTHKKKEHKPNTSH